ncbi:MAG: RNA polymerase Rbp10 [Thaumarchaeota archaeon]|nr:RNA polymerase Rbp10 [Nitrososphaerota archaeon]MCY3975529.1 RNA polymerase Rbp10 [Nitrososphaerota archaeon]
MYDDVEHKYDVMYTCLRCGTEVTNTDLNRLPEIKCICGFRVFLKMRSNTIKSINAI